MAHIVQRLREGGEDLDGVGVVTPYSAQVELLISVLRSLSRGMMAGSRDLMTFGGGSEASARQMPEVKTVDGYQGERV